MKARTIGKVQKKERKREKEGRKEGKKQCRYINQDREEREVKERDDKVDVGLGKIKTSGGRSGRWMMKRQTVSISQ